MDSSEVSEFIQNIPDEVLSTLQFSVPWQYDTDEGSYKDPDGFPLNTGTTNKEDTKTVRDKLQRECWNKFNKNPQVNTSVRGIVGRMTGFGFETSSSVIEIQDAIEEIELDYRNRLYNFWPKFSGRSYIEGELFLSITCHRDGFIEVDFVDPASLSGDGDDSSGIIYHPNKTLMPLVYLLDEGVSEKVQIPAISLAYDPSLIQIARKHKDFNETALKKNHSRSKAFSKLGGYYRFIIAWDKSFLTRRTISYLRTTLEWLNKYEDLKKYEIDHKKSSGAYLWVFKFTEPRAFKQWLSLSDEDRRKTGIMSKKTPGGSLVLPPGIDLDVRNPNLTKITEQDTDIMDMIASGLNEPEDVLTNRSRGTFASIKASRGPMNDRISDEIAFWEKFLRFDFWEAIFFLKSKSSNFKYNYKIRQATSFDKDGEPVFTNRTRRASQLIDINFPISEMIDYESRAKGLMGTKHGPVAEVLGIPNSEVASRMGFNGYERLRLRHATEKEKYPELIYAMDAESLQEQVEGEAKKSVVKKKSVEPKKPKKGE